MHSWENSQLCVTIENDENHFLRTTEMEKIISSSLHSDGIIAASILKRCRCAILDSSLKSGFLLRLESSAPSRTKPFNA